MFIKGRNKEVFRYYLRSLRWETPDPHFYIVPAIVHVQNWCRYAPYRCEGNWDVPLGQIDDAVREQLLSQIPEFGRCPERHVFIQSGDNDVILPCLRKSVVFKESTPGTGIPLFYPSHLDPSLNVTPIAECRYVASFQGSTNTYPWVRKEIEAALSRVDQSYFLDTERYFHNLPYEKQESLWKTYTENLDQTQFVVCPRGGGLNSIRFFEAMHFGRIPVLISDAARLPLEEEVGYDRFVVRVPESDVPNLRHYVYRFRDACDLREASDLARRAYYRYFADAPTFFDLNLRKRVRLKL